MTSAKGRWGRLKLASHSSDEDDDDDEEEEEVIESAAASPTGKAQQQYPRHHQSRFRRKSNDDHAAGDQGEQTRKKPARFRRQSADGAVSSPTGQQQQQQQNGGKKGLFARQREKRAQKKQARAVVRHPRQSSSKKKKHKKESGIKSDGDSADDDEDSIINGVANDSGNRGIAAYNGSTEDNHHYYSDSPAGMMPPPPMASPRKKRMQGLAELRRQQFQEQQLAMKLQRESGSADNLRILDEDLSDAAASNNETAAPIMSLDSQPFPGGAAALRITKSLDDMPLPSCAHPPPPRKKVSFGGSGPTDDEKAPSLQVPKQSALRMNKFHNTQSAGDVMDHSDDVLDLSSVNYSDLGVDPPLPPPPQTMANRRMSRERARYSVYHGSSAVKKRFRVRPYHCFKDGPVSMTEEEIYADSLKPSEEFVSLKSFLAPTSNSTKAVDVPDNIRDLWGAPDQDGRIGALRVEVLGCVSLNRTKPDVSVYLVCGDAAFCTDVLNGYRSPMWPSVSRRACVFPIHHAYAKLYVGVFDVRKRKNKENDVFCGRVAIDIASIRPNTEYDTTMPLRASAFIYDKRKRGVIRIRFSLHWFNERAAVISYFKSVRSLVDSCPLVEGQPTILCADPKTFRNVAGKFFVFAAHQNVSCRSFAKTIVYYYSFSQ